MTALLRHKGRGLDAQTDSIAELRRSVKEQDQALLDNLLEARTRLANLIIAGEAGPDRMKPRPNSSIRRSRNSKKKLANTAAAFAP